MNETSMTWTNEKPSKPGWYWYRYGNHGRRIYCITHPTEQGLIVHILEDWKLLSEMNHGQWAGPIPEPTEAPSMLECQDCHKVKPDVQERVCPYQEEINNTQVTVQTCDACDHESRMDI